MRHLTKAVVEAAAAPKAGQAFIRDDEIKGFALRLIATGGKSFVFEGRIKGRMRRVTIGRHPDLTVAIARQKALEIRAAIGRGDEPAEARVLQKHESTFGALTERYLRDYALSHKKPRSVSDDKYYLPSSLHSIRLAHAAAVGHNANRRRTASLQSRTGSWKIPGNPCRQAITAYVQRGS
jgi:hypothetical protein